MVELRLPKNSRVTEGISWEKPLGAENVQEVRIYRYNPEDSENPRLDTFFVDLDKCGPMILDALIKIKNEILYSRNRKFIMIMQRNCNEHAKVD